MRVMVEETNSYSNKKFFRNWKGGRRKYHGYWYIWSPEYHNTLSNGYIQEHVRIFEETYDCWMLKWGIIHHKDGNPSNNVWYNLQGMTNSQHSIYHNKGKKFSEEHIRNLSRSHKGLPSFRKGVRFIPKNRKCSRCGSYKTSIRKNGRIRWYISKDGEGYWCNNCYAYNRMKILKGNDLIKYK
jgi:hypothetical protein